MRSLVIGSAVVLVISVFIGGYLYYLENREVENREWCIRMAEAAEDHREAFRSQNKSAFVVGYTGASGKDLVKELLQAKVFSRIVLLGRREVKFEDELYKDVEQKVVDFEKLDEHGDAFKDIDVGFCCLGTTRAKAGKEGFIKVDHDYIMNTAQAAKANGCQHFSIVSSRGADSKSSFLYMKVKGQVEDELKELGFARLSIFRPAMLLGDREETRAAEGVARFFLRPVAHFFPTAMTSPTPILGKAMVNDAVSPANEAVQTFENKAIFQLAGKSK